ncbi:hypothetical protein [Ochrobactrum sp. 3-3]|uniref:hypothetical protein n=1 Tax=Ochrobactrum sp. 3-3 TaxID=1830124 RepID=UPI000DEFE950|nr:hypothetical protein [Ochrobactrum sp. 3-3]
MTDLITRLSKLDAPDREVDARIWCEVHGVVYVDHYKLMHETQVIFKEKGKRKEQVSGDEMPHAAVYTASVDAAIALAERVLPESVARRLIIFNSSPAKAGFDGTPERGKLFYYEAATPAIAACIALLRAKEASKL